MSDKKINDSLVKAYDHMASSYDDNRGLFDMSGVFNDFYEALDIKKGSLLDCGCGAGEPWADWFIKRGWQVTGIDLSKQMLNLAEKYVPQMNRICAPMQEVEFEDSSFEAISAIYSLFHLPSDEQLLMFKKFFKWLKSRGSLIFTYATKEYTHKSDFSGYMDFMGEKLYYSHRSPDELKSELSDAGFIIDSFKYRDIGGETFLWVTAAKR
jgi:ubiquinone/menaquinone biosynthesis C-methylase UbiE